MAKKFRYHPKGVCSQLYEVEINDDDTIKSLKITGGCPGNLLGISKMVVGMPVDHVIEIFEGTPCGFKKTSCPDQIARALKSYKNGEVEFI